MLLKGIECFIHVMSVCLQAIHMLETSRLKDDEEEKKWRECLLKLYLNLSLCNLKRKKPKPAITNCRRALEFDENNIKATFRLGKVGQYI